MLYLAGTNLHYKIQDGGAQEINDTQLYVHIQIFSRFQLNLGVSNHFQQFKAHLL